VSRTASPTTRHIYGLQKVCKVFGLPRSTHYHRAKKAPAPNPDLPGRRGPKPVIPDTNLLTLIREDLATTPFKAEGHRKVWARLRYMRGVRVSRKRVLRLMRENNLLSPYRNLSGPKKEHEGTITTQAPNLMWGTDGTRVFTLEHGWVWIFIAVEHWNGECVGWHVAKDGSRYAALEPIAQGLSRLYGGVTAQVARGLSLRMDHGTQYTSDHFVNQIRYWGIQTSFAFVSEPQTNGVAERFNRTLKEQAVYGRIFRTVEELRTAVGTFIELYNQQWRVEKNRFISPYVARAKWEAGLLKTAA